MGCGVELTEKTAHLIGSTLLGVRAAERIPYDSSRSNNIDFF